MAPFQTIVLKKDGWVARITLNRPQALNALNVEMMSELGKALKDIASDASMRVVVLTGAGGRAFSAGVDIKALRAMAERPGERESFGRLARETLQAIEDLGLPVIAVVDGYCLTGALELAMACDMIVASEDSRFGDTHARWGLRPSWGGSQRLPRMVGMMKAKELLFTAEPIDAREAERIGLINKAAPREKLEETVNELVKKLIANSPGSIRVEKQLVSQGMRMDLPAALKFEAETRPAIADTEERMRAFGKRG